MNLWLAGAIGATEGVVLTLVYRWLLGRFGARRERR
jgi:hypothetical protein